VAGGPSPFRGGTWSDRYPPIVMRWVPGLAAVVLLAAAAVAAVWWWNANDSSPPWGTNEVSCSG